MQYENYLTLEEIFRVLKKRWWLIITVTLMFLIGGNVLVSFFGSIPKYESSTTVLVNYRGSEKEGLTQYDIDLSQKLVQTYTEIIKSLRILNPVINELDLDITPDKLLKKISVSQVNETEIIKISVKDESPLLACDIANTLAKTFSEEISNIMKVDSTSILDEAVLPTKPLAQYETIKVAFAGILGMMVSVGLVFLFESLDHTIRTADETERILGVPVLGVIPKSKMKGKK